MKLLVDIGNTNTSIALLKNKSIKKRYLIHTSRRQLKRKTLKRLFGSVVKDVDKIIIVSVVPDFLRILRNSFKKIFPKAAVLVVGKNIKVPILVKYKRPREVGQDRLVTALGALRTYGCPILVIDFGTAVTFDFVSGKGAYEGGLIFPGMRLALMSLVENTALLPKIALRSVKGLIGRDTRNSMNKGIIFGYAAVCDGLIEKFRKKYGKKIKVVATGGDAALVAKQTRHINKISPNLIFNGLIFLENQKNII